MASDTNARSSARTPTAAGMDGVWDRKLFRPTCPRIEFDEMNEGENQEVSVHTVIYEDLRLT